MRRQDVLDCGEVRHELSGELSLTDVISVLLGEVIFGIA